MAKVMEVLEEATGGKSYKAHKYGLDHAERPYIEYGEAIIWRKTAETTPHKTYTDLTGLSKEIVNRNGQILTFFLDSSRRVFKIDNIAYSQSGSRKENWRFR
jgi:hypothetical protein